MPTAKKSSYPKKLTSRYGKVNIYRNVNRGKWVVYVVSWSVGRKRQRLSFSDENAAENHAELVLEQFKKGESLAAKVSSSKAMYYEACEQKLNGASLQDAVEFYLRAHNTALNTTSSVGEVFYDFADR